LISILIEDNLKKNAQAQIKRREPGITRLVKVFNDLCSQISALVDSGDAPHGAKVPDQIQRDGLFQLDVDNDIWQDIPLDDEGMPMWLGDEQVREGIKWMLQLDRCIEEEHRLLRERVAMQDWMIEEWGQIQRAQQCTGECN
jgi:hypothetical protein